MDFRCFLLSFSFEDYPHIIQLSEEVVTMNDTMEIDSSPDDLADLESALNALTLNTSDSAAITTLANASTKSAEARQRLADPCVLQKLVEMIEIFLGDSLEALRFALRCLGNACADNDNARDTVTALGFSWAIRCLMIDDDDFKLLATKVLYNICNDHDASQQQCYREKVYYQLIKYCCSDFACKASDNRSYAIELLLWITGHKAALEPSLAESLPGETFQQLLSLPTRHGSEPDIDTFAQLLEIWLTFLRDGIVQKQVIELGTLDNIWAILEMTDSEIERTRAQQGEDAEDFKLLQPLGTSLLWCLSDIAAKAKGAEAEQLCDETKQRFVTMVIEQRSLMMENTDGPSVSWDEPAVVVKVDSLILSASCHVLGNLLWAVGSNSSAHVVQKERIDKWLFSKILQAEEGPEGSLLLHSIAGLLIHLSRPSQQVREIIGSAENAKSALERLCRHQTSRVQQEGIKLLQKLGVDSLLNQQRFAVLGAEAMVTINQANSSAMNEDTPS